jgi:hypothetical protein
MGTFLEAFSACGYPVKLGVGARGPSALVSRGLTPQKSEEKGSDQLSELCRRQDLVAPIR